MDPILRFIAFLIAFLDRYLRYGRRARIIWPPPVPPVVTLLVIALVSLGFALLALWSYRAERRSRQKLEVEGGVALDNRRRQPPKAA